MPDFPRLLHDAGLPDAMTDVPTPCGAVLGSVEVIDCRKSEAFSESDVRTQEMAWAFLPRAVWLGAASSGRVHHAGVLRGASRALGRPRSDAQSVTVVHTGGG